MLKFEKFPWPAPGQKLIVQEPVSQCNAIFHQFIVQVDAHASAYLEAADRLLLATDLARAEQDCLALPILFLYRRHLELKLKDAIVRTQRFLREGDTAPMTHDLMELWRRFRTLIVRIEPNDPDSSLDAAESVVGELHALDAGSMTFRYAVDRQGRQLLRGVDRLSLPSFAHAIHGVSNLLDGCESVIIAAQDAGWDSYRDECY